MKHVERFVIGAMLFGLAVQVVAGDWGDALDGAVILGLYLAWISQTRRAERLAVELRRYRALVRDIKPWRGAW